MTAWSNQGSWRRLRTHDIAEALGLLLIWLAITAFQRHLYAANPSEAGSRIRGNLHALANPLLWPNILSASAFLLPYVFFNRRKIAYPPLRATLLLLPFWVVLLLSVGQILELRIYGDISVPVAVTAALIFLEKTRNQPQTAWDTANPKLVIP